MNTEEIMQRALELFPEKKENREIIIKFSRAFKGYNANCVYTLWKIEFRLSLLWKEVNEEIFIGLIQELFSKIYKKRVSSYNIEMYNKFIKKSAAYTKPKNINSELRESFDRVNESYFDNLMDYPNLTWGQYALSKLGSYDFMSNTISISTVLREDAELLDYVMYHEMLHKKLQYDNKKRIKRYHTKEFKKKESEFKTPNIEKKLEQFLKKKRIKKLFRF